MTTERNYSKAALGFDAVKASSSVKNRKGSLVATSPKNGRLPGTWFAVDGVYLPGSLIRFNENVTPTAALSGLTANPLAAGEHTIELRSGCLTQPKNSTSHLVAGYFDRARRAEGDTAVVDEGR